MEREIIDPEFLASLERCRGLIDHTVPGKNDKKIANAAEAKRKKEAKEAEDEQRKARNRKGGSTVAADGVAMVATNTEANVRFHREQAQDARAAKSAVAAAAKAAKASKEELDNALLEVGS